MPNYVKNIIKINKLKPGEITSIVNKITSLPKDNPHAVPFLDNFIDFDKIIPQPRLESECPADCKVNKDSYIEPDSTRPWFDWYEWNCTYWGTKWGAFDAYTKIGKSYIKFIFTTAWSTPQPIFIKLAELFHRDMEIRYADEDLGNNCGMMVYHSDRDDWDEYLPVDLVAPIDFAKRLWRNY